MNAGLRTITVVLSLLGIGVCVQRTLFPGAQWRSQAVVIAALERNDSRAFDLALAHAKNFPTDWTGVALTAEASIAATSPEEAIEHYRRLPKDGGRWEQFRELGIGRRLEVGSRLGEADVHYRRALELSPFDLVGNERRGHVLQVAGRTWEALPSFLTLLQHGKFGIDELFCCSTTERYFRTDERIEFHVGRQGRDETFLRLARARRLLLKNDTATAEELLREFGNQHPDSGEAWGRLGRLIVDRGNMDEFLRWRGALTTEASDHPEVWFAQGLQAIRHSQLRAAIRCYLEVLARAPNHLGAHTQLATALQRHGEAERATFFAERAELLSSLDTTIAMLLESGETSDMLKVARTLGKLERHWEAGGWCQIVCNIEPANDNVRLELTRYCRQIRRQPQQNATILRTVEELLKQGFPTPAWGISAPGERSSDATSAAAVAWDFRDEASEVGIQFQYDAGTSEDDRLSHFFNVMGGGLGVLDYDTDGWPDLYLAQGGDWRLPDTPSSVIDPLYRNRHGQRFTDVTGAARLAETGFSQGVAIGDANQDGFPDLYITNIGRNTLYLNQGDGTYRDATAEAGVAGDAWSTSSVFADLNSDGLADLYVLNYAPIEQGRSLVCKDASGAPMSCPASAYTPEPDQLYLNRGDGRFEDVSIASGISVAAGKGLGVVAWDFADDGSVGLFVANDTDPNFLWIRHTIDPSGIPQFRDEGRVRGVAYDLDGNAQASMGVAAGDVTGDGRLDLLRTTFFGDSNTLASQLEDGSFLDLTRPMGIRDSGFWMLGFGCQFADFDQDGWPDLVIANGHVDRVSSRGTPDRMRPQLLQNVSGRKFHEISASELGAYFGKPTLGRGLATLDWNRDGATDFAVSHLHDTFALVTNRTRPTAPTAKLRVRLRGGHGNPTAVGAVVSLPDRHPTPFVLRTSGDGYLVTNEDVCPLAIPGTSLEVTVRVHWPNGETADFARIPVNTEVLIYQDRRSPVVLGRLVQ